MEGYAPGSSESVSSDTVIKATETGSRAEFSIAGELMTFALLVQRWVEARTTSFAGSSTVLGALPGFCLTMLSASFAQLAPKPTLS